MARSGSTSRSSSGRPRGASAGASVSITNPLPWLREALDIPGISGHEDEFIAWFEAKCRAMGATTHRSRLGSCIAKLPGTGRVKGPRKKLMLAAHADSVGMIVNTITSEGFLRVVSVGGVDTRLLPAQDVWVHGTRTVPGVFGSVPPHFTAGRDSSGRPEWDELFVDVGLPAAEVHQTFRVGDLVSYRSPAVELLGDRVCGRAMDNRASVVTALLALQRIAERPHALDVFVVATVQEEVTGNCSGAATATHEIVPDVALAVDVTHGDTAGVEDWQMYRLGKGPTLCTGPNVHPGVLRVLVESAKAERVPCNLEPAPTSTGTDAMDIQPSAGGVATGVMGVPLRYMHSAVETLSLKDVTAAARLLARFAVKLEQGWERED